MRLMQSLAIAALLVLFAGCGGKPPAPPPPPTAPTDDDGGPVTRTVDPLDDGQADPFRDPSNPLSQNVIYFDYDQATVRSEYVPVVNAYGKYLLSRPGTTIRLEGHADERGSREYNIGLAERRAQAVRTMMRFQGVPDNQITTVSYGEERPAMLGSGEAAWSKNRRVEFVRK